MSAGAGIEKTPPWATVAALAFVAFVHGVWMVLGDTIVAGGGLADGDSFLHLIRAERLWQGGNWYDVTVPDANAPFGTTLHWTRLFDIVLLTLALPMTPLFGFSAALYWAGAAVSPLLHLLLAAAVIWALRPIIGRTAALLAGGLTATQFGVLAFAIAGRADHHMMFALFLVLALGFIARTILLPESHLQAGRFAGLCIAAGIWTGPEFLLFLVLCLAGMGLPWLLGQGGAAARNLSLAQGLAMGLAAAVLIERGQGIFAEAEFDRLSLVHFSIGALLWVYWAIVGATEKRRWFPSTLRGRLALAAFGAAAAMGIIWLIYPGVMANPLTQGNPEIVPIFAHISEYGGVQDTAQFLIYFGSAVFVVPWLIWRFRVLMQPPAAGVWLVIVAGLVVYLGYGLGWIRWSLYAAIFLTIVLADLVVYMDGAIDKRIAFPARVPFKVLVLAGLIIGPVAAAGGLRYAEKTPEQRAAAKEDPCPLKPLSAFLNTPPWSERPRTIAASANFGAELMYRTGHKVLATVHHRNIDGILDGHRILGGADDGKIEHIIARRRVDLLLLCPLSKHDGYFVTEGEENALYTRLVTGAVPPWLRAVELPAELGEKFRLFEVHRRR